MEEIGRTFADGLNTTKSAKVFSLKCFAVYGIQTYLNFKVMDLLKNYKYIVHNQLQDKYIVC